jgi:hypothetical protein
VEELQVYNLSALGKEVLRLEQYERKRLAASPANESRNHSVHPQDFETPTLSYDAFNRIEMHIADILFPLCELPQNQSLLKHGVWG